jgi:hypothetical protein
MTETEQRRQRVELRMDLEDGEQNLAHLQERAIRSAQALEAIARRLRENAKLEPSRLDFDVQAELEMRLTPEEFGMLKASADGITGQIAEMRQTRQMVFNLRERDAKLSMRQPK